MPKESNINVIIVPGEENEYSDLKKKKMSEKIPKSGERYKPTDSTTQGTSNKINPKNSTPTHVIIKLLNTIERKKLYKEKPWKQPEKNSALLIGKKMIQINTDISSKPWSLNAVEKQF